MSRKDRRAAMHWGRAASGLRYRIVGSGKVILGLESGVSVLAESSERVHRRGAVDWSLAAGSRGVVGRWLDRAELRVAGMEAEVVSQVLPARCRPITWRSHAAGGGGVALSHRRVSVVGGVLREVRAAGARDVGRGCRRRGAGPGAGRKGR